MWPAIRAGPRGVALDRCGNLYIADTGDNRVRKITIVADGGEAHRQYPLHAARPASQERTENFAMCVRSARRLREGARKDGGALFRSDSSFDQLRMTWGQRAAALKGRSILPEVTMRASEPAAHGAGPLPSP